jgi:hypothetical protein
MFWRYSLVHPAPFTQVSGLLQGSTLTIGKPSAPAPPDPVATAQAQAGANVNTASAQSAMNNMNQYTPYGSTTYDQTGEYTTPDGQVVPRYTQYTSLSPAGQYIHTGQQAITSSMLPQAWELAQTAGQAVNKPIDPNSYYNTALQNPGAAGQSLNTVNTGYAQGLPGNLVQFSHQAMDRSNPLLSDINDKGSPLYQASQQGYNTISERGTPQYAQAQGAANSIYGMKTPYDQKLSGGPQTLNGQVTDAIYNKSASYLDPQFADQRRAMEGQLSRQGIPVGSEAYNSAMRQLGATESMAYDNARNSAIGQGAGVASQQFNDLLAGRGQNLQQQIAGAGTALQSQGLDQSQRQAAVQAANSGLGLQHQMGMDKLGAQQGIDQNYYNMVQGGQQAAMAAQNQANAQQNQGFNQALSGQQQWLSQQQMQQQQPVALLQALMGAAPITPGQPMASPVPAQIGQTDVMGANAMTQNARNQAYQGQVAGQNALYGGLATAAGSAAAIAI